MIARPFIQASGDMSRSEHDPDMSRSEHDPTDFHRWYTYPSEKYQSVGMIIPNIWKHIKCSKPPSSIYIYYSLTVYDIMG